MTDFFSNINGLNLLFCAAGAALFLYLSKKTLEKWNYPVKLLGPFTWICALALWLMLRYDSLTYFVFFFISFTMILYGWYASSKAGRSFLRLCDVLSVNGLLLNALCAIHYGANAYYYFWFFMIGYLAFWMFKKSLYNQNGDGLWFGFIWYGFGFLMNGIQESSFVWYSWIMAAVLLFFGITGMLHVFYKALGIYQKPVILFDFDGTLGDTQTLVFETFKQVFKEKMPDYKLSQEELYSFYGPILEESFGRYFPKEEVEDVIQLYQDINVKIHDDYVTPMPNALKLLKALKKEGYTLGVLSNKRIKVVEMGLKACHMEQYFALVMGKEDLKRPKPYPDGLIQACNLLHVSQDNIIYVGDNPTDVYSAKNLGCFSIGYSADYKQLEALAKADPCALTGDLWNIYRIVKENETWNDNTIW